jgi:hypothetical protein
VSRAGVRRLEEELNEQGQKERDERGDPNVSPSIGLLRWPSNDGSGAAGLNATRHVVDPDYFLPRFVVLKRPRLDRDCVGAPTVEFSFGYETAIERPQLGHVSFEAFYVSLQGSMRVVAILRDHQRSREVDHRRYKAGNGHE